LGHAKPGIVAAVMSNLDLEGYLDGLGITLARTPVGDRYVLEHMRAHSFKPSGHIILTDHTTTGDGLLAALQVLAVKLNDGIVDALNQARPELRQAAQAQSPCCAGPEGFRLRKIPR